LEVRFLVEREERFEAVAFLGAVWPEVWPGMVMSNSGEAAFPRLPEARRDLDVPKRDAKKLDMPISCHLAVRNT